MKNLIVDSPAVCHRAIHTTGNLSLAGKRTGVVYGFFQQLFEILKKHRPDNIIFTWDSRESLRREIFPPYKEKRNKRKNEMSVEEKFFSNECYAQFHELRSEILPKIGFKNNFMLDGYESDDLIASIINTNGGIYVIASSDNDLFQLLSDKVIIYDIGKKKEYTQYDFEKQWSIPPNKWLKAKSIAGCSSDEVPGIKGIGKLNPKAGRNNTAIKYINGELKKESKAYQSIINKRRIMNRNKKLIELPYRGTPMFSITKDTSLSLSELKMCFLDHGFQSMYKPEKIQEWKRLLKV